MKKNIFLIITTMLLTGIITTILLIHNIKITNIKNENITINLFGFEFVYCIEE